MREIIIVGPKEFPIPNVKGGAIQTLVTSLIDENEKEGSVFIHVITCANKELDKLHYRFCELIQIKTSFFAKLLCLAIHVINKLFKIKKPAPSAYMMKVNRILSKSKCKYVLFESGYSEILNLKKTNQTIIYHIHSDYINSETRFISLLKTKVDFFLAISSFIKKQIVSAGFDEKKVFVFHNCVPVEEYSRPLLVEEIDGLKEEFSVGKDKFVFAYCGRLSEEKGCLELVLSFNKLCRQDCALIIIGGSNFSSNKKTEYVKELEKESLKNKNIIFTGYVNHKKVIDLIKIANVGVIPSTCNEACSLALLEFRCAKIPTIAFDVGGIREFAGKSTLLVKKDEFLIDGLKNMLDFSSIPQNYTNLLAKAIDDDNSIFSESNYYKEFIHLINRIDVFEE